MKPRDRAELESQGKWDKRQWQGGCWLPFTLLSLRHTLCAALRAIQYNLYIQNAAYFTTQWPLVLDSTLWHWQLPPPTHRQTLALIKLWKQLTLSFMILCYERNKACFPLFLSHPISVPCLFSPNALLKCTRIFIWFLPVSKSSLPPSKQNRG